MTTEAELLLNKGIDALVLSVEHFNRPFDQGRTTSVLILMDHAFEMLLKASILHRGGNIHESGEPHTIGFDACIRRALSQGQIKFLSEDQAITVRAINNQRDAAQHYLNNISEQQLYIHVQSGFTVFKDILQLVFDHELVSYLPNRVLPVSTLLPTDLHTLFATQVDEVRKLFHQGVVSQPEVEARLRPLVILDATLAGDNNQPSISLIKDATTKIMSGQSWESIFPDAAVVQLATEGNGLPLNLRMTKQEGLPIYRSNDHLQGLPFVERRVNELDFYNLGLKDLSLHVKLSPPKTTVMVRYLKLEGDATYFKEIMIGKMKVKRYSQHAIKAIKEAIDRESVDNIWQKHRPKPKLARKNGRSL